MNIGFQQIHFPLRGPTHHFDGVIALVVPDLPVIEARLKRLEDAKKFKDTPYRYKAVDEKTACITAPMELIFGFIKWAQSPLGSLLGSPI